MERRTFLTGSLALAGALLMPRSASASAVLEALETELAYGTPCEAETIALRKTIARMRSTRPPAEGARTIVVDLPSQNLAAYDGREVSLESRVVVGDPSWETPDLETSISYVRMNPTWTPPESIVAARDWRAKLRSDPGYFENLDFDVVVGGRTMAPREAATAGRVDRFVQRPGPINALGRAKIGLNAGNAIYLHDTLDVGAFDENERALSHGCVRVEEIVGTVAWILGVGAAQAEDMIRSGDTSDRRSFAPVRVATTYFTAWPDADGTVHYYPDVYGRDGTGSAYCSGRAQSYRTAASAEGAPVELTVNPW